MPAPGRGVAPPALLFALAALPVVALVSLGDAASAHFLLNVNIRIFHVVHEPDRIRLLARLPLPWLVADKLGPETAAGTRAPAPYTTNRIEDGALVHYLDADALRRSPEGLAGILADRLVLEVGDEALQADIGRVRAWPGPGAGAVRAPGRSRSRALRTGLPGGVRSDLRRRHGRGRRAALPDPGAGQSDTRFEAP